jgi:DHA1 family multidrug resistance protein-like MFS transporter
MVAFEEPEISKDHNISDPKNDSIWDSPPETAVNTAAPSQAPSIHGSNEDRDRDLENAITTEKVLSRVQQVLACADPITHVVGWDGEDDPANPMNFPRSKKWIMTMSLAAITFCVSFSSSVFSTATTVTAEEFGISLEVMILGVSLYVLGFACGMSPKTILTDDPDKSRSSGLGTALRGIWSHKAPLHRLYDLHHIPDSRGRSTER